MIEGFCVMGEKPSWSARSDEILKERGLSKKKNGVK